ncbi:hypothetical protein TTHERM_000790491 (macronuclear) [Tetrahymena thermophila SB210]|uniref:Uncharacterized protein n=1 Tax=Tetrahymena thermophila (strain SB210) TaxID=312017 RepID=W7X4U4_TETTS|nr:hypothetical protein TTHERM_000790491 [Tetrahymena thermophila SB210]EWS71393.1 hypothetical protein TTHERM_000790491 [Tetrahymena thermophila SB210]|eukprot:XP_012656065.1 hypothetical protein TTHERM_000790491 [Tetrahymena thermophila SB210]
MFDMCFYKIKQILKVKIIFFINLAKFYKEKSIIKLNFSIYIFQNYQIKFIYFQLFQILDSKNQLILPLKLINQIISKKQTSKNIHKIQFKINILLKRFQFLSSISQLIPTFQLTFSQEKNLKIDQKTSFQSFQIVININQLISMIFKLRIFIGRMVTFISSKLSKQALIMIKQTNLLNLQFLVIIISMHHFFKQKLFQSKVNSFFIKLKQVKLINLMSSKDDRFLFYIELSNIVKQKINYYLKLSYRDENFNTFQFFYSFHNLLSQKLQLNIYHLLIQQINEFYFKSIENNLYFCLIKLEIIFIRGI